MTDDQHEPVARVLIVEDDSSQAFLAATAFSRCSVANECAIARDGIEGLAKLRTALQEGRPYDLVFVDLNMPHMDGRTMLTKLKSDKTLRRTPVVILTTSSNPDDVDECYDSGATSYIMKPFGLGELFAVVESTMVFWFHRAQLPTTCVVTPES